MIHASGPRADGPFVPVNCGAIPSELMESEFFGHKRGSFTGAVADKLGLMPSAEGGTLFLDEVADLPLHMQVKLLRVIQEKTVRPIGDQRESPIDVRIVSATHKNLADLVADAKFREDLYYRINVIEIRVPPLRERRHDIRPLAEAILGRLEKRVGLTGLELSTEAWRALETYHYPGNVRELENVLERAVTLSGSGMVEVEHIRLRAVPRLGSAPAPQGATPHVDASGGLSDQIEHLERDAIIKALEQTRYNKTAAAKLLGVTYRALRYKIQKLEIE
jgi:two-component system response regulator PilR (NtrC family)